MQAAACHPTCDKRIINYKNNKLMRKILMLCMGVLAFCSCAKNYPQMVKERVEQYRNEGKVIYSFTAE